MHVKLEILISLCAKRELSLEGMSVIQRCGVEKIMKNHEYSANGIHFYCVIHFERMLFL
jgi:hypothetical protein